jgi:hypothetical protein
MTKEISSRLLKLQGIDYENDPEFKELIETAWKDQNPDRVLRYCEHISAACTTSVLGESVQLPTLGPKTLTCEIFKRTITSQSLDRAFEGFKRSLNCESCKEWSLRPADWQWSPKWVHEEAQRKRAPADQQRNDGKCRSTSGSDGPRPAKSARGSGEAPPPRAPTPCYPTRSRNRVTSSKARRACTSRASRVCAS